MGGGGGHAHRLPKCFLLIWSVCVCVYQLLMLFPHCLSPQYRCSAKRVFIQVGEEEYRCGGKGQKVSIFTCMASTTEAELVYCFDHILCITSHVFDWSRVSDIIPGMLGCVEKSGGGSTTDTPLKVVCIFLSVRSRLKSYKMDGRTVGGWCARRTMKSVQ